MQFRLLTLTLLFSSVTASVFANEASDFKTAVFADGQFTSSSYGIKVIKKCLNPQKFRDTKMTNYYVSPGGKTIDLLTYQRNNSHQIAKLYTRYQPVEGDPRGFQVSTNKEDRYIRSYFRQHIEDDATKRIMVFMGTNEIGEDRSYWNAFANRVKESGKECVIGLPLLSTDESLNKKIVEHNKNVQAQVKDTSCVLLDPSKTLNDSQSSPLLKFKMHKNSAVLSETHVERAAIATCNEIEKYIEDKNLTDEDSLMSEQQVVPEGDMPEETVASYGPSQRNGKRAKKEEPAKEVPAAEPETSDLEVDFTKDGNNFCGDSEMSMIMGDCSSTASQ